MHEEALIGWGIVELLGHVRLDGYITEESRCGGLLGRIDIPGPDGQSVTQWFGASAIYRLTPTTEEVARAVARTSSAPFSSAQYHIMMRG